jgi:3-(3-hydroxy-phenyl)propionate hydroxylase
MVLPGDDSAELVKPEKLWELVSPWVTPQDATLEPAAIYTFHSVLVHGWRKDRLLLAGDACHQTPPFLGQGMCAGIRDAANLAWKLVAVLREGAQPDLLDSYEAERSPHVKALIELAVRLGTIIQATDVRQAAERDARLRSGEPQVAELPPSALGRLDALDPADLCHQPSVSTAASAEWAITRRRGWRAVRADHAPADAGRCAGTGQRDVASQSREAGRQHDGGRDGAPRSLYAGRGALG